MSEYIRNTNYHTLEGLIGEVRTIADISATPAETVTLGYSHEERPMYGICFGNGDHRKPEILYFALTHSMEFIGAEMALEIIRKFASGKTPGLEEALKKLNVWVIPVLNPDGYARVEEQLNTGLGLAAYRGNSRGVDLNRNFPVGFFKMPRSFFAGSKMKVSPHYKGSAPCSEKESQVLRDFIIGRNIRMSMSFHSFGSMILIPYAHTRKKCRDHEMLFAHAERMASVMRKRYEPKAGNGLYFANGEIDDWLYEEYRVLPFTVEMGKLGLDIFNPDTWLNPFYWANPADPAEEVENVMPAAMELLNIMLETV